MEVDIEDTVISSDGGAQDLVRDMVFKHRDVGAPPVWQSPFLETSQVGAGTIHNQMCPMGEQG